MPAKQARSLRYNFLLWSRESSSSKARHNCPPRDLGVFSLITQFESRDQING